MKTSVIPPNFREATWIERLAISLEQVAADARPSYYPLPTELGGYGSSDERWSALRRGYRDLAARAKYDSTAAVQFKESHLRVDAHPAEAIAILRDHPLIEPGLEGSVGDEAVQLRTVNKEHRAGLMSLVLCLAKLTVKEGGEEAARRLHCYLTAGANGTLPAVEVTVIHGLVVKTRFPLGAGAYLATYEDVKTGLNLPDEPEPLSKTSYSNAAVLVRAFEYGPGVAPPGGHDDLPYAQVTYGFPAHYQVDLEGWWEDSKLLVDLLSIANRVPLLSRTCYVRVANWVAELDPNLALGTEQSGGFVSDTWPQGRDLFKNDVEAFTLLAHGWRTYPENRDALNLAIRRLAGSFSRPGGRFGLDDRILDVAIALEVLYGGTTGRKLARRAAAVLGSSAVEQTQIYDQATDFYKARSRIVHWKKPAPAPDVVEEELEPGRNLACLTLSSLLSRGAPVKWADVMRNLLPETQAYIDSASSQWDKSCGE